MNRVTPLLILVPFLLAAEADGPSILALMHKQYDVSRAPFKIIKAETAKAEPDWDRLKDAGDRFADLAATLAKRKPRHGTPESWRDLIDRHTSDAKAMQEASAEKDLAKLRAAHQRIGASCKTCHDAHRARRGE